MIAKPLVAATDGSEESLRAVEWAARAAAVRGVPLRVVSAVQVPGVLRSSDSSRALRSHWLRPLELAQSTWAPVMPSSTATAGRGHPRAVAPSESTIVTRA